MKKLQTVMAATLIASLLGTTGCFGQFAIVRKLYGVTDSIGNKFGKSVVTWVFVILPVYFFGGLADFIVLNVIEFWSGKNPLSMKDGDRIERVADVGGTHVKLTFEHRGHLVRWEANGKSYELTLEPGGSELRDGHGQLLAASRLSAGGDLEVVDGAGNVMLRRGPDDVAQLAALIQTPDLFTQQLAADRGPQLASSR